MHRNFIVLLTLLVLPTSVYSAADTEDKKLVNVRAGTGSFVVINRQLADYCLNFSKDGRHIESSYIAYEDIPYEDEIDEDEKPPIEQNIKCPKDFDTVSLYCLYTRKCLVTYPHTEVKEGGAYRVCLGQNNETYFFDNNTRKKLLPVETERDDNVFSLILDSGEVLPLPPSPDLQDLLADVCAIYASHVTRKNFL